MMTVCEKIECKKSGTVHLAVRCQHPQPVPTGVFYWGTSVARMRPSTIATGARIVAAGDEVPQGTLLMTRVKAGVSGCVTAVSNAGRGA